MVNLKEIKKELETVDSTKIFFVDFNGRIMSLPVNPDNIESIIENGIDVRVFDPAADAKAKLDAVLANAEQAFASLISVRSTARGSISTT